MLSGVGVAQAQDAQNAPAESLPAPTASPLVSPPQEHVVKSLKVEGSQRIEPATVLSYTKLRVGETYTTETVDQAIKDLLASDFLADVSIEGVETGNLIIHVKENPVINRIVLEGNKHLKDDKIKPEIKLAPRQIFTRTAVRADVARIIELYRRQGRFGATVDPQMVSLDQNRVDVIFEIHEGGKSKVRAINIIGNEKFSDSELRSQMATKQSKWFRVFSSNTSYDQDRLSYDQQKLRQFYLTQGYADFRVTSAVAELTPDKEDFIITYVVEEGDRYKFGPVTVHSGIRDFDEKKLQKFLPMKEGDWYNAKMVEDTVDQLTQTAGTFGYAFADVRPEFTPNRDDHTMAVEFNINQAKRTYVERVNITGNTQTKDKVVRREMRLAEGDAFNSLLLKRSEDRINSLGYFQDKFEIKQSQGSDDDRIVLDANVEEKPTGELSLSAGFSSLERFILQGSIQQNNFRGMGQTARAQVSWSSYAKSAELGFTEPYLFDRPIALGGTLFRRDYNSFSYINGDERNTTYSQVSTGFQIFTGVPLTEYWTLSGNYTLSETDVTLSKSTYYKDTDGDGVKDTCDPVLAGRYLCDAIGNRLTSMVGAQIRYNSLNSRLRPTKGETFSVGLDFAGVGGDTQFLRATAKAAKYWSVGSGFIFSLSAEGGAIKSLESDRGEGVDEVRITDRFYLGQQQFRGFDIRGIGPRVQRVYYTGDPEAGTQLLSTDKDSRVDDALGGKYYYLGKAELEIPLGSGARELGLRPSIFAQVGALFGLKKPLLNTAFDQATDSNGNLLYNDDGSPTLLPRTTAVTDSSGRQIYVVPSTASENAGATTTCSTGYSSTYGGTCSGTSVNTIYTTSTSPYYEQYLGDSALPRISIGIGVDWNSPFGPLRLDLAKAIYTQPGDDPKLFTFNVGTQF
ncbi:outer membrane protein assembly factor BamA [Stakelama sp. CBK3Z-3]|uniref:Outer membrane protein assembly factor BamA n=2 Tax=Stakelama flava TaxID=2860338 RepID=A0ABS6XM77_9SPHN|nr:outer membrane protein assembly factor BamA [Stakelama flava]MBW4330898.1 outer membrane protein assembly factor BamA [Stakelama flava]